MGLWLRIRSLVLIVSFYEQKRYIAYGNEDKI